MDRPDLETFARRPREALMWVPRARDVARLAAVCRAAAATPARPRVVDVGAGTGLLGALLEEAGVPVACFDPAPPPRTFHAVDRLDAAVTPRGADLAIVSWMEAGSDYREAAAALAPVVVNAYDVEGGCGVLGATDLAPFGFHRAVSWRTPSFEDALFALERKGRQARKGYPGNRVDVLVRDASLAPRFAAAVNEAAPGPALPWEAAMDALGL